MNYNIGDKIYNWTIISSEIKENVKEDKYARPSYILKCTCGSEMKVRKSKIVKLQKEGESRALKGSCKKCLNKVKRENRTEQLKYGTAYSYYKSTAKKRNIHFDLTKDECIEIFKKDCTYCGSKPNNIINHIEKIDYTGIDRIDSSKGYIKGNVTPCCKRCNAAKNDMSVDEFLEKIESIYLHSVKSKFTD